MSPYETDALDLSNMRVFISGGEAVPIKTAVEFSDIIERYGAPRDSLRAGFGMTETGVRQASLHPLACLTSSFSGWLHLRYQGNCSRCQCQPGEIPLSGPKL